MSPPVVFIFRDCPPPHLMALAEWGFSVTSLSRCPGVEHVADVRSYIEGRFVIIVGDRELAEELGVGHATVAEVICLTDSKCNNFESADVTTELAGVLADNLTKLHQGRKPPTRHRHVTPAELSTRRLLP